MRKTRTRTSCTDLTKIRHRDANPNAQTDDQVQFILTNIGMYKSNKTILSEYQQRFGRTITRQAVAYYANHPNYQALINKERKKFESTISDVEIASKRRRVENLNAIFNELLKEKDFMNCVKVIREVREEVEGIRGSVFGNVYQQFNQYNQYADMSDDELMRKLEENSRKLKIIDSEDAMDQGVDDKIVEGKDYVTVD